MLNASDVSMGKGILNTSDVTQNIFLPITNFVNNYPVSAIDTSKLTPSNSVNSILTSPADNEGQKNLVSSISENSSDIESEKSSSNWIIYASIGGIILVITGIIKLKK